jgi:hypothetical protein
MPVKVANRTVRSGRLCNWVLRTATRKSTAVFGRVFVAQLLRIVVRQNC